MAIAIITSVQPSTERMRRALAVLAELDTPACPECGAQLAHVEPELHRCIWCGLELDASRISSLQATNSASSPTWTVRA